MICYVIMPSNLNVFRRPFMAWNQHAPIVSTPQLYVYDIDISAKLMYN